MSNILTLNLKGEHFDLIKRGFKDIEYRLYNDYWRKRIENKNFDFISIRHGYPKSSDTDKIILFHWFSYKIDIIVHPEFGDKPVKVFAICLFRRVK